MKVGFFKSILLFFFYRKKLNSIRDSLSTNFGAKVDYIYRIYTVLNIPKEIIEEPYNFRGSDIDKISQNYIKQYSSQLQDYLNSLGLRELFDFYEVKKVDKSSYLLIFGFSLFNTRKVANNIIYFGIFSLISLFIFSIVLIIIKLL